MQTIGWIDLMRAEAVALLACTAGYVMRQLLRRQPAPAQVRDSTTVFLFDGDRLIDANAGARSLLTALRAEGDHLRARLLSYLAGQFPDVAEGLDRLERTGHLRLSGQNGIILHAELSGGITRIALDGEGPAGDGPTQTAQATELARLRRIVAEAPVPLWQETPGGEVIWANAAYVQAAAPDTPSWPLPRLFPKDDEVELSGGWLAVQRNGRTGAAWPLTRAKKAEAQLTEFRQTLARTFADLPTGLAIFDRQRHLQIFNPALLDLTGLPPDLLSSKLSLYSFLDALRERSLIPEPKDYSSWRRRMIGLEEAASHGRFEETWSLPTGQTWRVVGRPHPDGAMALLFEDISSEITRTRRYRADLELGQAVIDAMEEAVAVFSPSGTLVISNSAYARLWNEDPGGRLDEANLASLCAEWRAASAPSTLWAEIEAFAATLGPRTRSGGEGGVRLNDGRWIECRYAGLAGGATLIGFRPQVAAPLVVRVG
ncbi:PAS-domain containing protein [Falsirhodobacter deserti]|uniref:PAS-domain containing protein n=1 Tax=Falsirhodobacter deserti TaxID=1365611 RepID=UPI001F4D6144|nr:PAS-domain containing protein [Falsirhodobacter deserti]